MRIVHTSDWHAGRLWKGVSRLPELEQVLDHLAEYIEREQVDVLIHSGDVFDNRAPSADAERAVFGFFKRVGQAGVKTVIIAGNHDGPERMEAWGALAELVGVHVVARPRRAEQGGLVELSTRTGERALVAALPFASSGAIVSALQLATDESDAHQRYAEGVTAMCAQLCAGMRPDTVNVLVAHTHLEGALVAGSERKVHVGSEWASNPQALPAHLHYVALGHIHKPQRVPGAPSPTFYAGSPLQLDFGEAGEEKSFVVVEAHPGEPASITRVPYVGGKALADVHATLDELEQQAPRLREAGWLRVTVRLQTPDPDINARVRRLLPNAVAVLVDLPTRDFQPSPEPRQGRSPLELFREFHRRSEQREPDRALVRTFEALLHECREE